jgi:hypothetical protein
MSGLAGEDIPKPNIAELDPQTKDLIQQAYNKSQETPDQVSANQLRGVNDVAQKAWGNSDQSEEQRGGLMDPNMVSAIRSKYGSILGERLTGMKNQEDMNMYQQRASRLKYAQNYLIAQQKVENQNYQRLLAATNNENEIKAGVVKSWLSLGGTVIGGAFGGPAGAMAGSQVGGAAGGMVTGRSGKTSEIGGYENASVPTQNSYMNSSPSYSSESSMGNYGSNVGSGRY